ncbi:MAG: sulfide/dihydroorotate dehydrogenase-like FAD/NAD-binding protein [Candidatus Omnitrophica bacterium]|nr:sulfide/dihydroorotate dehydrogenase-like FAD/NAD-binding protein [Candidatus Omnitrophota bacterium]
MNKIISKRKLSEGIYRYTFENKELAIARKPGQFLILRVHDKGERIPLTIMDSDSEKGTVDIIFQAVGKTTNLLSDLNEGDRILDVAGPLGNPTLIENFGRCVAIGGGVGTAVLFPVLKALKEAGNYVIAIIGARDKDTLILIDEVKAISDELVITTDDGSAGTKGFVTDALNQLIGRDDKIDYVYAVGPVVMMKNTAVLTKEHNIKTEVSLNPIMVDGTGMCGSCRCMVDGKERFACIHGPDFDGHKVDFNLLTQRLKMFEGREQESMSCGCEKKEE